MRISDWSSDVCSSDLHARLREQRHPPPPRHHRSKGGVEPDRGVGVDDAEAVRAHEADAPGSGDAEHLGLQRRTRLALDRKSVVSGKSVSVRVDLGGRRIIKKKNTQNQ